MKKTTITIQVQWIYTTDIAEMKSRHDVNSKSGSGRENED